MQKQLDRKYTEYLVLRAKTGDRAAFNLLAEHYEKRLLAFAMRMTGEGEMARDAVQDAWADIVRGFSSLSDSRLFNAWAYKIVSRRCFDQIRKVQRRRKTNSAYEAEPRINTTSGDRAEKNADHNVVLAIISELPQEQRLAMILYYSDELSVSEIAHTTGVPVGTVKTRLLHARKKVRAQLKGESNV
ncbi:MAG: sigma-70 family RNA polymerase sigma factor [Acidimicrobiales bacterium]|nr:sigma-70 family RNA polymerase sigma factor [Hyphomonadaceae bacterium]RZV45015.1 MAG: sigma-70 family RNA polymerase sigma factor [Acidimicrobiales bacterium]